MRLNDMRRETQTDVAIIIPPINDARVYNTDIPLVGRGTHTPLRWMIISVNGAHRVAEGVAASQNKK
jgi:hypothetical protein